MNTIDNYFAKLDPQQGEIAEKLRTLLLSGFPQLKEELKWSRPVYTLASKDVAYILTTKQGLNFGLIKGALLNDPKKTIGRHRKRYAAYKDSCYRKVGPAIRQTIA